MSGGGDLIVAREGAIGRIRLNRPRALNALTIDMVRAFAQALDAFAADPEIVAVFVTGEGERGLCAGGDIRALHDLKDRDKEPYKAFWRAEYRLDARVAAFPKPYVVLMDGVVMGGGVGISAHGNRRIVTERTRLAMPETSIGFIPDAGGTWLLSRGGGAGLYMGLSGVAVTAGDALHAGLADVAIETRSLPALERGLLAARGLDDIDALLRELRYAPPAGELEANAPLLDRAMTRGSVEEILAALREDGSDFAQTAAREIGARSPTSLKVAHALLERGKSADSLETCLRNEFRAACAMLGSHDLYEGVRAAVVDKDRRPRWSPGSLEAVDAAAVTAILAGTGDPEPDFGTAPTTRRVPRFQRD